MHQIRWYRSSWIILGSCPSRDTRIGAFFIAGGLTLKNNDKGFEEIALRKERLQWSRKREDLDYTADSTYRRH